MLFQKCREVYCPSINSRWSPYSKNHKTCYKYPPELHINQHHNQCHVDEREIICNYIESLKTSILKLGKV